MNVGVNIRTANLAVPDGHGESMRNLSRALVTTNPGHTIDFVADAPARFHLPCDRRAALRVLRPFPAGNRLLRGAFVFIASFGVWQVLEWTLKVRVPADVERLGQDSAELGMESYPEFVLMPEEDDEE